MTKTATTPAQISSAPIQIVSAPIRMVSVVVRISSAPMWIDWDPTQDCRSSCSCSVHCSPLDRAFPLGRRICESAETMISALQSTWLYLSTWAKILSVSREHGQATAVILTVLFR